MCILPFVLLSLCCLLQHAVLGMADSLHETPLDADQSECVFTIHACSELMLSITDDILDYARIDGGEMTLEPIDTDLYAMIHSLVRGAGNYAQERAIKVTAVIDQKVPQYIRADVVRLNQVIMNLVSNGKKKKRI